jgi:hypothetical protein
MNAEQRLKQTGLDAEMVEYLCGMSADMYGETAFDREVQFYLNQIDKDDEKTKRRVKT